MNCPRDVSLTSSVVRCLGFFALVVGVALAGVSPLGARIIIVEIHYHPAGTAEEGQALEFVELYNDEPLPFDIYRYRLEGGISYRFPPGTVVEGGGVVVVASDPAALSAAHGTERPLGPFGGRLGNEGDEVALIDTGGSVVSRVRYNDRGRWPAAPDGAGPSLVLRDPLLDPGESESWGWSRVRGGTPAVASFETVAPEVLINEVVRVDGGSRIELFVPGLSHVDLSDYRIAVDPAGSVSYTLPPTTTVRGRGFLLLGEETTGLSLDPLDQRLYLFDPLGERVVDARRLGERPAEGSEGRYRDGAERWLVLDPPTPGEANRIPPPPPVVISEIHYQPYSEDEADEFLELTNIGAAPVDLEGFSFIAGISFTFSPGTSIAPGEYLVIARDPARIEELHGLSNVLGPHDSTLSNGGEMIRLVDRRGRPVDEVRYYDEGTWPRWADGYGPSLELVDLRQDNGAGSVWQESDHAAGSVWRTYEYTGVQVAAADSEFHLFLMGRGEILIDDIEIVDATAGRNHLPDGDFEGPAPLSDWLVEGTHVESRLEPGAGPDGSNALRVVASKRGDTRANRIERQTSPALRTGESYTVRFKARWLRGTDLLMTRSWNHGIARATRLEVPRPGGTPGRPNSRAMENSGPVIAGVEQEPPLPPPGNPVTVRARVSDPDGVAEVTLLFRLDGGSFQSAAMRDDGGAPDPIAGDGVFAGTIDLWAPQAAVAEFYLAARDASGFERTYPPGAPEETCLYQYRDSIGEHAVPAYRIVMRTRDYGTLTGRSLRSNHVLPASLVYRDERIFHLAGVRYRGSPAVRIRENVAPRHGFRVRLSDENPLQDAVRIALDEQLIDPTYQVDRTVRHFLQRAGGIPYGERRHVHLIVQGRGFGTYEQVLAIDGRYLERAFGAEHSGGELYKLDNHYEIEDDEEYLFTRMNWRYTEDEELLRLHFKKRSHEKQDDFSALMELLDLMDRGRTSDEEFDQRAGSLIDLDGWVKAMAVYRACGDWDAPGGETGKNVFLYHHPDGRWRMIPWDHDVALGSWPPDPPVNRSARAYLYTPYFPEIRRLLTRPALDRRFNAELLRLLEEDYHPDVMAPVLRHTYELLRDTSGAGSACPGASWWRPCLSDPSSPAISGNPYGVEDYLRVRHGFILGQIHDPPALTIETNGGEDFATARRSVLLSGEAPFEIETLHLNGELVPVRWRDRETWELDVPLETGVNELEILGFTNRGGLAGSDEIRIEVVDIEFLRGDPNDDGRVNIADSIFILDWLFLGGANPGCVAVMNTNGDEEEDMSDAIYLLLYLFAGGAEPAMPFPECGLGFLAEDYAACDATPVSCR